ncbi:MAG: ABC transporter permease [candidate division Zixibacteria bacterium]|nr:ABC transporter permease [candidate division Zixibacteria bacterium]
MVVFGSIFRIAGAALWANKLRSGLTFVGIVFGVTSVMTIITALEGATGAIEKQLDTLGPSTFMVAKLMSAFSEEEFLEKIKRKPVSIRDAEIVEEDCHLCEKVSPRAHGGARVKYGDKYIRNVDITAGTANIVDIVDFEVAQGRFHSTEDDLYKRRVVLIGDDLREEFFEGVNPLGKVIKIGPEKYTVIGVAERRGEMFGESQDGFAIIPLSAFIRQFGEPRRRGINMLIKARSVELLPEAMDEVRVIMRTIRKVPYDEPDDFDMETADSILEMLNNFTRMFRLVMVGISTISLVIGGIVVMNIMMVSVTERTREIGIRKSIGAKQKHILLQFLFESVMLTLSGGVVGIILGFLIAQALAGQIDMDIEPSMLAISAGLTVSTGIGLIFGIYPAMKAARMDPIKALSYE